jgi:hypothetical protein
VVGCSGRAQRRGGDDERERRSPQFNGKLRESSRMNVVFVREGV